MHSFTPRFHAALLAVSLVFAASTAAADILPPDACQDEGATCDNAGPQGDQAGVCKKATCSRPEPKPDGGIITYECLRCTPGSTGGAGGTGGSSAGEAGTGGTAAGSGGTTSGSGGMSSGGTSGSAGAAGGSTSSSGDSSGCNCRLTPVATERGLALLMLFAGFLALRRARRSDR